MSTLRRVSTVFWMIALSVFCHASIASTLDLSGYPNNTPLSEINTPGFTFELSPGVSATVIDGRLAVRYGGPGVDLRIIFSGTANQSDMNFNGYGSCQLYSDFVYWYLDDSLEDTFATFIAGAGRCRDGLLLSRSFEHNEIWLDIYPGEQMAINQLSNDVVDVVDATPVPVMSIWAVILLSAFILLGAVFTLRRKTGQIA